VNPIHLQRSEHKTLPFRSMRARLMLWNVCALAMILAVLGVLIQYTVKQNMLLSIDRELAAKSGSMHTRMLFAQSASSADTTAGPGGEKLWMPSPLFDQRLFFSLFRPVEEPRTSTPGRDPGRQTEANLAALLRPRILNLQGESPLPFYADRPFDAHSFSQAVRGQANYGNLTFNNEPIRVYSKPVLQQGRVVGVIQIAHPLSEVNRAVADMDRTLLALIPVALLLAGIGGALLTKRALRPVQQMAQTAEQIGAQDLSRRLGVLGQDEFSRLAETFNAMLTRLETAFVEKENLVRQLEDLVEQQRRFTGDASHEIRTPLTIIKANTSLSLRGDPSPQEYREAMEDIDQAADTMNRLVYDLLLLARSDGAQLGRNAVALPVREVLEQCVARVAAQQTAPIRLEVSDEALHVSGNPDEIVRLFSNLLDNAVRYTSLQGRITITAQGEEAWVKVAVADTGVGIAPEHLPHLGERFYRVDEARSRPDGGAGLGLSICKSIVEAHDGTMEIASEVGVGTTVSVTLPRAESMLIPESLQELEAALLSRNHTDRLLEIG
jgi:signal transduction histidine kinase